ncbi:MAG: TRAP transporter TatT component family protein [Gammaproteobacteria bacterium]|jgi:hypothetical protein|nr:TRAP transporter TatT component family protein [Gammaproteobacteria bacterium]
MRSYFLKSGLVGLCVLALGGCASIVERATGRVADNLTTAMLQQNDPQTVRDGMPAYLIMIDGLVEGSPSSVNLLLAGSRMYGAYVGAFVDEPQRARRMADKGLDYARRALCIRWKALCDATGKPFSEYQAVLRSMNPGQVDVLYGFASAWATWIQAYSDDWNAIADLPKVEAAMRQVVTVDPGRDGGSAQLYLGVLLTLRPPSLGGKPEEGRAYFERAVAISEGRNLIAKVYFAERYARTVFNQELHDRLLREVIEADPVAPRLTLSNLIAQRRARRLLAESPEYF